MEIMTLPPLYLDTLLDCPGNPIQLNPWPPDSLHQTLLTSPSMAAVIEIQDPIAGLIFSPPILSSSMEALLNSLSMFNKLEEESAVLRQYLEYLQVDLGQLMEKHGVAGEVFDEKYELRKPDETTDGANKSRELFESGQSTIVGSLALEGWKDDGTLPHGWKTRQPVKNPKDAQELNETCEYFEAGSREECHTKECKDVHYKEQCHSITKDVCNEVPKQHCVDVPEEKCVDMSREHCKDVVNKHCNAMYTDNCKPIQRHL